jgi:hypothetical protein
MDSPSRATVTAAIITGVLALITGIVALPLAKKIDPWINPPPTPTVVARPPQPDTTECIHPTEMARRMGWAIQDGSLDPFGGLQVAVASASTLAPFWEANGPTHITQVTPERVLSPGVWTIYTPFACRSKFGFAPK